MISGPDIAGQSPRPSFLILGGGFSGVATATHLALQASEPIRITLLEPAEQLGRGLAYGSVNEHWLLNVPAGRLSIDPAKPGDFHHWAVENGRESSPDAFLPRAWFGAYTQTRLEEAVRSRGSLVEFVRVRDAAEHLDIDANGVRVSTRNRATLHGEHAVLALGNGPTRVPKALQGIVDDERVLRSPFLEQGLARLATRSERIVLVGTGLTMFDAVVGLERLGYRGQLIAVSRRGQLARPHGPKNEAAHAEWAAGLGGLSLTELIDRVRVRAAGGDWRGVIDSLRPHTSNLWGALSARDRARFLARVAVYWDVHRHRAPSPVHAEVASIQQSGRLRVFAGTVDSARRVGDRIVVRLHQRNAGETTVYADGVVLCTGPDPDPCRWGSPLIDGLLADGLVTADTLGLGLRSDADGHLIGSGDHANYRLSTLGPLRHGELWESTAVPEIARQAAALGARLIGGDIGINQTAPSPAPHAPTAPHHRSAAS